MFGHGMPENAGFLLVSIYQILCGRALGHVYCGTVQGPWKSAVCKDALHNIESYEKLILLATLFMP